MVPPPLKNMSSSDWIIIPTIGEGIKVVFQITNQPILCPYTHHKHLPPPSIDQPTRGCQPHGQGSAKERQFKGQEGVQAFVVLVQPAAKETTGAFST